MHTHKHKIKYTNILVKREIHLESIVLFIMNTHNFVLFTRPWYIKYWWWPRRDWGGGVRAHAETQCRRSFFSRVPWLSKGMYLRLRWVGRDRGRGETHHVPSSKQKSKSPRDVWRHPGFNTDRWGGLVNLVSNDFHRRKQTCTWIAISIQPIICSWWTTAVKTQKS